MAICNKCVDGWIKEGEGVFWCDCKIKIIMRKFGERFKGCELSTLKLKIYQKQAEVIIKKPEDSYFLIGDFKQGKTHLVVCQYNHFLKRYRQPVAMFFREVDLIEDWQDWEKRYYIASELRTKDIKHIFIDDIGRGKVTERVQQEMYNLTDWVYSEQIGLSISSNFGYDELAEKYGGATARRIKDICQKIEL